MVPLIVVGHFFARKCNVQLKIFSAFLLSVLHFFPFLALLGRVRLKIFLNFHLDVTLLPRLALLVLHFSCFSQLDQCQLYLLQ